ncbi:MAG: hypothetical protein JWN63_3391 [Candidatus Acidoferrum typicum]|jgi:hypothetical protein|nr:hypothetical protein [Candidatus Acidoferrum typicum]
MVLWLSESHDLLVARATWERVLGPFLQAGESLLRAESPIVL